MRVVRARRPVTAGPPANVAGTITRDGVIPVRRTRRSHLPGLPLVSGSPCRFVGQSARAVPEHVRQDHLQQVRGVRESELQLQPVQQARDFPAGSAHQARSLVRSPHHQHGPSRRGASADPQNMDRSCLRHRCGFADTLRKPDSVLTNATDRSLALSFGPQTAPPTLRRQGPRLNSGGRLLSDIVEP